MFNPEKHIRYLILAVLFGINAINLFALQEKPETLLAEANQHYLNKEYREAITIYEKLVSQGFENAELFYNLGNAYYKTEKAGYAVLYYERALKLSPSDEDIVHNLALVNTQITDKVDSLPKFFLFQWWENLLALFTLSGWTYFAYLIFIFLIGSIILYFFASTIFQQKIAVITGSASVIFLIFVISLLTVKLNREVNIKSAVIVEPVVTVKLAPDIKSNDAFIIHEGLKVKVEDRVENWIKIRLADGKIGWMTMEQLQTI